NQGHAASGGPHRFENGDVAILFHDEEDQRRDDVEGRDNDYQTDRQRNRDLLECQRRKERTVRLAPVLSKVISSEDVGNRPGDRRGAVDIVDPELDEVDLTPVEESPGEIDRDEPERAVELVEPEAEDAGNAKAWQFGHQAEWRQRALRRDEGDRGADLDAEALGQILAAGYTVRRRGRATRPEPPDAP